MDFNFDKLTSIIVDGLVDDQSPFVFHKSRKGTFEGVKAINFVIGANNSGKSRLIRSIFRNEIIGCDVGSLVTQEAIEKISNLNISSSTSQYTNIEKIIPIDLQKHINDNLGSLCDSNLYNEIKNSIDSSLLSFSGVSSESVIGEYAENVLGQDLWQSLVEIALDLNPGINSALKEYIPVLRGLRTLDDKRDVYLDRTIKDYFKDCTSPPKLKIFTGHTLYNDLIYAKFGNEDERESVEKYQQYLSEHFFEGQKVDITPRMHRDQPINTINVIEVKIGQSKQMPIYQLGDGIQAIITLTVRPFLETNPTIFLIEEPEHNLHAGMQRALIAAFRACPQHMFFLTTQSNHFVDLTLDDDDINLISVSKSVDEKGNEVATVKSQANNSAILKELGVLASSVLLANCSIWVEGVTDKRYLQVYLAKFIDELKSKAKSTSEAPEARDEADKRYKKLLSYNENLHYVFVEYQGSNITHWAFSEDSDPDRTSQTPAHKLNKDIFLLADADIETKGSRVEDLRKALGDNFYLLKRKEIENYIPQNIIIKTAEIQWDTFNGKHRSSHSFADLNDGAFNNEDIGIGATLEECIERDDRVKDERFFYRKGKPFKTEGRGDNKKEVPSPSSGSTIKEKTDFCDLAVKIMQGKNDGDKIDWQLTPELYELCDQIWKFIEDSN